MFSGALAFTVIISSLVVWEIFVHILGMESFVPLIEEVIGPICHHLPDRFLVIKGQLPVCARCTGLYLGFILAVLGFQLSRLFHLSHKSRKIFLVSCSVSLLSLFVALLEGAHLINTSNGIRLFLGLGLGIAPAIAASIIMENMAWKLRLSLANIHPH